MVRNRFTAVLTVVMTLALSGTAWANSGAILSARALSDGQVQATYMSSSTYCDQFGYCGWFPYATQAPLGEACNPYISRVVYIGNFLENRASQTGTDAFLPEFSGSFKICLHLDQADRKVTVAERIITRTAVIQQTPTARPPPEPVLLTRSQAERTAKRGLTKRFGRRYQGVSSGWMRCNRTSQRRFVCRVAWNLPPQRVGYKGTVTVWHDFTRPRYQIRVRKRSW